jgi:hypothetical protein
MAFVLVVLCAIPLVIAAAVVNEPVSRKRVERFARRHELVITPTNGRQVIAYLATTRRWRATGLACGVCGWLGWTLPHRVIGVNGVLLFAGWFAGALAAELRIAGIAGRAPAAVLAPRTADRYLSRVARSALPASTILCAVLAAVAVLGGTAWVRATLLLAGALVVAALVRLARRHVLTRAQPLAPPDELAADNAIRSGSLHALAGSGTALVLYAALGETVLVGAAYPDATPLVVGAQLVGMFAVPWLGWRLATTRWPVAPYGGHAAPGLPAGPAPR